MWLAYDGLGFHDCYFKPAKVLAGWRRTRKGYAAHVYDQGIGRALWFVSGGEPQRAAAAVRRLPAERASDLFAGLGLAMAYAGPNSRGDLAEALKLAGREAAAFGQGIAFACEARARAAHIPAITQTAAEAIEFEAAALAALTRQARDELPAFDRDVPRYELWRRRMTDAVARGMESEHERFHWPPRPQRSPPAWSCFSLSRGAPPQISPEQRDALAARLRFQPTYLEPADNGHRMRRFAMSIPRSAGSMPGFPRRGRRRAGRHFRSGRPADICL